MEAHTKRAPRGSSQGSPQGSGRQGGRPRIMGKEPRSVAEARLRRRRLEIEVVDIQNQLAFYKEVWEDGIEVDTSRLSNSDRITSYDEYRTWRLRAEKAVSHRQESILCLDEWVLGQMPSEESLFMKAAALLESVADRFFEYAESAGDGLDEEDHELLDEVDKLIELRDIMAETNQPSEASC